MKWQRNLEERPEYRLHWKDVLHLYFYVGLLLVAYNSLPNSIWDPQSGQFVAALATIGIWRYLWWTTHFVRSIIFRRIVYPYYQENATENWVAGQKPKTIFCMITAYHEEFETLKKCIDSILREAEALQIPVRLFFGTGDEVDEKNIEKILSCVFYDIDFDAIMIRQEQPGKRVAIGLVLKAISRYGIHPNDPVVFMDGDSILGDGCLQKCLPLFSLDDNIHAMTTNEIPIVSGPNWVQKWFDLRFSQRHMIMQSHALAGKVITLTGRMSIFRAKYVTRLEFIRTVEADYLDHWLWGTFRFISGDDKSTWYYLLKQNARMLYVPDAITYTIDVIEDSGVNRMSSNLFRWAGNMLRNGARAIALGPRKVGFFIWWCLVDQRLAIWTMLLSPVAMLFAAIKIEPSFITVYFIWVATTRLILSLLLSLNIGRLDMSFPFFLYVNQLANSIVKVNLLFRLPKQPWLHRMNQISDYQKKAQEGYTLWFAHYLTALAIFLFCIAVLIYAQLLPLEAFTDFQRLFAYF